jgi:hypothetical protein
VKHELFYALIFDTVHYAYPRRQRTSGLGDHHGDGWGHGLPNNVHNYAYGDGYGIASGCGWYLDGDGHGDSLEGDGCGNGDSHPVPRTMG